MDYQSVINFYYRSNYGTFTEYLKNPGCDLAFSAYAEDPYFNHIVHYREAPKEILARYANEFSKRNRKPTLYLTPLSERYASAPITGFTRYAEDSWMKRDPGARLRAQTAPEGLTIEAIGAREQSSYLSAFRKAFGNPNDIYGALPEGYCEAEKQFFQSPTGMTSHVILCKQQGDPIGVVRAVAEGPQAFIYALGVDPQHRRGGVVAGLVGDFITRRLLDAGVQDIYLQTEAGSPLERLYQNAGFKRIFTGIYFVPAVA